MKDVENIGLYLLFIEQGERSTSQLDLDKAFSDRDEDWINKTYVVSSFKQAVDFLSEVLNSDLGALIEQSRLRNVADFYSLFAAVVELAKEAKLPEPDDASERLVSFLSQVERGTQDEDFQREEDYNYLVAARSASNDAGPRRVRIDRIKSVLQESQ